MKTDFHKSKIGFFFVKNAIYAQKYIVSISIFQSDIMMLFSQRINNRSRSKQRRPQPVSRFSETDADILGLVFDPRGFDSLFGSLARLLLADFPSAVPIPKQNNQKSAHA